MRNREGWKVKTLGEVCEVNYGTRVVKNKVSGTKYYVYGGGGATFTMDEYNREDSLVVSRFAMSQQCVRFVQGKFFLNDSGLTLSVKEPESLAQHFLNHHMFALNDEIYNLSKGVAQRNLDVRSFRKLEIKIPPLPTQHQIVAELDTLNSIIDKKKEQLNELDNLAQATFYDMFGDPVENEKGWEVKKLGDISDLKAGVFVKADDIYPIYEESLFQCYGGNGIRGYVETSTHEGEFVLIGRQGALCGNVKKAVGKFHATEHAVVCTPIIEYNIDWFYFTLFFMNLNQYATGAAQPGLSVRKLVTIDISVPSLPLQTQFAEKIKHIEQQKALIQRSIDDVQQLFDYTMDKYFN